MQQYDNSTSPPDGEDGDDDENGVVLWEIFVFLLMCVPTVLVNAFVVLLVVTKNTLRTATNLILASLACSDFLMGAVGIPLIPVCSAFREDGTCIASAVFIQFISFSSVVHIMLLTTDRYIYIMCALRYDDLMHRKRACKLLAIIWTTSLIASVVRLFWVVGVHDEDDVQIRNNRERIYHIFFFAFFCLLFVVISFMDARMMCVVHRQTKLIYQRNLPSNLRRRSANQLIGRKRKAVLTCILILIVYVICWFPYFVLDLMQPLNWLPIWLQWFIYYIRFMSSACNPWFYTLRKQDLRRAALSWLRRTFPCLPKRPAEQNTSILLHTSGTIERVTKPCDMPKV